MGIGLKRPILLGGLGLSATFWLLETVDIGLFDSSTLLSAIALGSGLWWWKQRDRPLAPARPIAPPVVDRARVEAQLADLKTLLETLSAEAALIPAPTASSPRSLPPRDYEAQRQGLLAALDRTELQIAVVGDRRTGKTTLINYLATLDAEPAPADQPRPPLSFIEVSLSREAETPTDWLAADGVLIVTDGDITASAFARLKDGVIAGQGTVLVFNKADHYALADQQTILAQLQKQAATLPVAVPVVRTAAAPRPTKVRRHQADGTVIESLEETAPIVADLDQAVARAILTPAPTLIAATTLRQAEALRQQIQADLNQVRRQRAMPIIEQLQWIAGAAAFANPVPTLDLLATVAINGQLIMDLGKVYGFNLSLEEAKTAAGTLASLTVKLGLVELSTQALTAVLKSHFATYLAGGTVQGISAAYLTRMAGLSLIDYFEQAALAGTPATALSWEAIGQRLQTVVQQNRQMTLLQTLVKQGIGILKPTPALAAAAAPPVNLALNRPDLATPSPDLVTRDSDSRPLQP